MPRLVRVDLYDQIIPRGGSRIFSLPADWIETAVSVEEIGAADTFTIKVPHSFTSFWNVIAGDVVMTPRWDDGTEKEFRTHEIQRERAGDRAVGTVEALSIRNDLGTQFGLLEWLQADGTVLMHSELRALTPSEHVDEILQALQDAVGAPALLWLTKGTIEPTEQVDMIYDWDSAASALEELATQANAEWDLIPNLPTGYTLELRNELNGTAEKPHVRYAKNELALRETESVSEMGTVIYPRGYGDTDTPHATPGGARWEFQALAAQPTQSYKILGMKTNESDQIAPYWVEQLDGTFNRITASTPNGDDTDVTLFFADTLDGERMWIRADGAGRELIQVSLPSAIALYDEKPMILDRPDIIGADNLLIDPYIEQWTGAVPTHWGGSGPSITVTQETDVQYRKHGPYSAKCVATAADQLFEPLVLLDLTGLVTAEWPNLSLETLIYVESGSVRLELFDASGFTVYPTDALARTSGVGWHHFSVAPAKVNFFDLGSTSFRPRLASHGGAATWYTDVMQLVNRAQPVGSFVKDASYNRLWNLAIDAFADGVAVPQKTHRLGAVDLNRIDPARWPHDEIKKGVRVRMYDPQLGDLDVEKRIRKVERNELEQGATTFEVFP